MLAPDGSVRLRSPRGSTRRAQNPSARAGNLLICRSTDALLELRRAIAGKNKMRMRIHKARRHAAAWASIPWLRRNDRAKLGVSSNRADAAVFDQQSRILDQSQFSSSPPTRDESGQPASQAGRY